VEATNSPQVGEIPSQQMVMLVGSAWALSGDAKAQNLLCEPRANLAPKPSELVLWRDFSPGLDPLRFRLRPARGRTHLLSVFCQGVQFVRIGKNEDVVDAVSHHVEAHHPQGFAIDVRDNGGD